MAISQFLTIPGHSVAAGVADGGNTGDGTLSLANPAWGVDVQAGDYILTCISEAANLGTFSVVDPDGNQIGIATVDTLFTGELIFTIDDGTEDWDIGDIWTVTVTKDVWTNIWAIPPTVALFQFQNKGPMPVTVRFSAGGGDPGASEYAGQEYGSGESMHESIGMPAMVAPPDSADEMWVRAGRNAVSESVIFIETVDV